ncbi:MAG: type II and III secretion system protein family protein [Deltaproteobacteria bacterium]|nr:type II and III secretion system protein family protein [Deltaproteobacteria bacterium]
MDRLLSSERVRARVATVSRSALVRSAVGLLLLLVSGPAQALNIDVSLRGTRVVRLRQPATQLSLGDVEVAEVKLVAPTQLLISGRKLGQTVLTIWQGNRPTNHVIRVTVPIDGVEEKLAAILPNEQIKLEAMGRTIVLTGRVSDPVVSERAQKLVDAHLQGMGQQARVLNFLTIRGRQQVQLRVKIAEVSRQALRQMGVNLWGRRGDYSGGLTSPGNRLATELAPDLGPRGNQLQVGGASVPGTPQAAAQASDTLPLLIAPFAADSFGLFFAAGGALPLSVAVSLLQGYGLAKILSEPTLVTYSGQQAQFLAGGEFPVPVPQALGQTSIEYKKFGVQLSFSPTVLGGEQIHLKVSVSVSERDQGGAVLLNGVSVPSLTTRHTETTVRMKNGQAFAIAGLLQDRIEAQNSKIPLLGDLPILGMFFRSKSFVRREAELVILVRAQLVQPLNPGEVPPLPGDDEISDPGALAFFLLGSIDPRIKVEKKETGPAGPYGYSQ